MNLMIALVVVAVVMLILIMVQRIGQASPSQTVEWIRAGAPIIDVRTPQEFARDAIPGAVNIPLNEVGELIPTRFADRAQPFLLHCLSGSRSMVAVRKLRSMGYQNVSNLGSYGRAKSLALAASSGTQGKP